MIAEALPIVEALCLRFEGLRLRPYLDCVGIPTIGIGSTRYLNGRAVSLSDPAITREHAIILMRERLKNEFMPGVIRLCPGIDTPQRLAAITDAAYNIGLGNLMASTLRKRINAGRWDDVPTELRKWVRGGSKILPGLVRRREAEAALI